MFTDEQLIAGVRCYPPIWDQQVPAFRYQNRRLACWGKLAAESQERIAALKERWNTLRRKYYREKHKSMRLSTASSGTGATLVSGGGGGGGDVSQQQGGGTGMRRRMSMAGVGGQAAPPQPEVWPLLQCMRFLDEGSAGDRRDGDGGGEGDGGRSPAGSVSPTKSIASSSSTAESPQRTALHRGAHSDHLISDEPEPEHNYSRRAVERGGTRSAPVLATAAAVAVPVPVAVSVRTVSPAAATTSRQQPQEAAAPVATAVAGIARNHRQSDDNEIAVIDPAQEDAGLMSLASLLGLSVPQIKQMAGTTSHRPDANLLTIMSYLIDKANIKREVGRSSPALAPDRHNGNDTTATSAHFPPAAGSSRAEVEPPAAKKARLCASCPCQSGSANAMSTATTTTPSPAPSPTNSTAAPAPVIFAARTTSVPPQLAGGGRRPSPLLSLPIVNSTSTSQPQLSAQSHHPMVSLPPQQQPQASAAAAAQFPAAKTQLHFQGFTDYVAVELEAMPRDRARAVIAKLLALLVDEMHP